MSGLHNMADFILSFGLQDTEPRTKTLRPKRYHQTEIRFRRQEFGSNTFKPSQPGK